MTIILWALAILLLAYGFAAVRDAWLRRPRIGWDPNLGRYRSARRMTKERART